MTILFALFIDVNEVLVLECSNDEEGRSPLMLGRLNRGSAVVGRAVGATVDTPFKVDFTTGSSSVLSNTRSSIGIGCTG